jgi:hypothetical protein
MEGTRERALTYVSSSTGRFQQSQRKGYKVLSSEDYGNLKQSDLEAAHHTALKGVGGSVKDGWNLYSEFITRDASLVQMSSYVAVGGAAIAKHP